MTFIVQAHHFLQNLRQQLIVESNRDLLSKYKRLMELYMLARKTNSGKKPNVEKHPVLSNSDQMITVSESIDKLKSGSSQELVYGNSSLLKRENLEIIFKKVGL